MKCCRGGTTGPSTSTSGTGSRHKGTGSPALSASAFVERLYRWSGRWHDDPPVRTVGLGYEHVIYQGTGNGSRLED